LKEQDPAGAGDAIRSVTWDGAGWAGSPVQRRLKVVTYIRRYAITNEKVKEQKWKICTHGQFLACMKYKENLSAEDADKMWELSQTSKEVWHGVWNKVPVVAYRKALTVSSITRALEEFSSTVSQGSCEHGELMQMFASPTMVSEGADNGIFSAFQEMPGFDSGSMAQLLDANPKIEVDPKGATEIASPKPSTDVESPLPVRRKRKRGKKGAVGETTPKQARKGSKRRRSIKAVKASKPSTTEAAIEVVDDGKSSAGGSVRKRLRTKTAAVPDSDDVNAGDLAKAFSDPQCFTVSRSFNAVKLTLTAGADSLMKRFTVVENY